MVDFKTIMLLDKAGIPARRNGQVLQVHERVSLLVAREAEWPDRERRSVLDARSACAAAVDLVAARFEKLGMADAAAAARECAVVVRLTSDAPPAVLRCGPLNIDPKKLEEMMRQERASVVKISPVDPAVDVARHLESGRQGMIDVVRRRLASGGVARPKGHVTFGDGAPESFTSMVPGQFQTAPIPDQADLEAKVLREVMEKKEAALRLQVAEKFGESTKLYFSVPRLASREISMEKVGEKVRITREFWA